MAYDRPPRPGTRTALRPDERQADLDRLRRQGKNGTEVHESEHELMTYLTLLRLDERFPEAEDIDRLRRANQSVYQTRRALRWGRGNVVDDLSRTNNASYRRAMVAREVRIEREAGKHLSDDEWYALSAACAMLLGSGNCGEYCHLSALFGGRHLRSGETMNMVSGNKFDHMWAELRTDHPKSRDLDVAADAWSPNSATFRIDSKFAFDPASITVFFSINARNGPDYDRQTRSMYERLSKDEKVQKLIKKKLAAWENETPPRDQTWSPTRVLSREFIARAKMNMKNLMRAPDGRTELPRPDEKMQLNIAQQRLEIVVAGVARQLGANVRQSARAPQYFHPHALLAPSAPAARPGAARPPVEDVRYARRPAPRSIADLLASWIGIPARGHRGD